MSIDREYDWGDVIENDGPSYTLLPEGEYPFEVVSFERKRFAGSAKLPPCNQAELTLLIDGGALGRTTVYHSLFLHTKTEGLLFETLCRNRGQLLPRELLYLRVWGPEAETEEQGVDNYIHFLRRRLRTLQSGCRIVTVRSLGYRLEEKEC